MKNKHLTASDRQTIRELLHGGKNYVQIAEILKKSLPQSHEKLKSIK